METLESLAEKEELLLRMIAAQTGPMEEKATSLRRLGLFDAYEEILRSYLALLPDPAAGLEALKRAVFLAWYGLAEPPCFSGLNVADQDREAAIDALGQAFEDGRADSELRWMVSWYHKIADFPFSNMDRYPRLHAHATGVGVGADGPPEHVRCGLGERGQMSDYWQSINDARRSRSKW